MSVYREAGFCGAILKHGDNAVPIITSVRLIQDGCHLSIVLQSMGEEPEIKESAYCDDEDQANDGFVCTFMDLRSKDDLTLVYCFGPMPDPSRVMQQAAEQDPMARLIELLKQRDNVHGSVESTDYNGAGYGMYL